MSKRKKTRQQKIIADLRRQVHTTRQIPSDTSLQSAHEDKKYTIPNEFTTIQHIPQKSYSIPYEHTHLEKDLRKTMILTTSIIVGQLILFLLIQNRIIALPFVN